MLKWSDQRKFYENPLWTQSTNKVDDKTVCIRFCVNKEGNVVPVESTSKPFANIVSLIDNDQQAIVTGLYAKYLQNDFAKENMYITIHNLFVNEDNSDDEDDNKPIKIPCPPKYDGLVSKSDEIIYKPSISQHQIMMYANKEKVLFEPSLAEIQPDMDNPIESYFQETHPLICCLVEKGINLNEFSKTEHEGKTYYAVKAETIDNIKEHYEKTIFKNIHYTRFEDCRFECTLKGLKEEEEEEQNIQRGIVLLLQIDYVLTNQ